MHNRKISWWMTSCYYPSWKHSQITLAHYTSLEILDVFSPCSWRTVCYSYQQQYSSPPWRQQPPHRARNAHLHEEPGWLELVYTVCYPAEFCRICKPPLGLIEPRVQRIWRVYNWGQSGRFVELPAHLHLDPKLIITATIHSLPYVFVACTGTPLSLRNFTFSRLKNTGTYLAGSDQIWELWTFYTTYKREPQVSAHELISKGTN
jgi:hypothetical protein